MSLINTFELLDCPEMHIPGGLSVSRTSKATTQDEFGDYADNATVEILVDPIMAHPVKDGRELLQVPEADRAKDHAKFYTRIRLYCDSTFQDFIAWRGRSWRINFVEDYDLQGGGYVSMGALVEATL